MAACLLTIDGADLLERGAIRTQAVGDDGLRATMAFQRFLDEFQRRGLVPFLGDKGFQDLALVIDGAPEIAHLAVDFDVDLVAMPFPVRVSSHVLNALAADL